MKKDSIILSKVKRVAVSDFVINPNYEVVLTPSSLVHSGFFKKKPYGHYSISEVAYGGWINHNEDYINKIGLVIHNDKVCWPPELIVYYTDGTKSRFVYKTYEEAEAKRQEILASIGKKVYVDI